MILISTMLGLEVMTLCTDSDSFTLFDGDKVAADFVNGSEIEEAANAYRINQTENLQV